MGEEIMFEVKFGTPKPVTFREYCEYGKNVMDIDLEARFAGKCEPPKKKGVPKIKQSKPSDAPCHRFHR